VKGNQARAWSCDTFVAQTDATTHGRMIFGKNSDRPAGEAQPLRFVPARPGNGQLELAYVSIKDEPAYAHIGAAPYWCWGYEFGINEHNVSIGNEAQFTRAWAESVAEARNGRPPSAGLIGMELLRLGLERARTATEALDIMTALLEQHGQWASGIQGQQPSDGSYDNSFLITDGKEAWVLETSGREWISRRLNTGIYSISNEPSIRTDYDQKSEGLLTAARNKGWLSPDRSFDYAETHVDPGTSLQVSHMRQRRSQQLLQDAEANGGVSLDGAKAILRDHFEGTFLDGPYFNAARPDFLSLCMHEHPAGFTWGNTAGSIIVESARDENDFSVIWWTPLPPCVGAYIPIFMESGELPKAVQIPEQPTDILPPEAWDQAPFDPTGYWWKFQNLLDAVKGDALGSRFPERQPVIRAYFDTLEMTWAEKVSELRNSWNRADAQGRENLVPSLRNLTAEAVEDVQRHMDAYLAEYAPEGLSEPLDPRWLGNQTISA
jgi:secernin